MATTAKSLPPFAVALAPIVIVLVVNLVMTWLILPRLDMSFLDEPQWAGLSRGAKSGLWSVLMALVSRR